MGSQSIRVEGLNKLVRDLKKLDADLAASMKRVNRELAGDVADTARATVPRRTGRLAGSLRAGATQRSGVVRAGGAGVPYAGVVHFGWAKRKIRPRPFLYDALDARRDDVQRRWAAEVDRLVKKVR